ncbi:MAG: trypsin-like serine protease [Planctomycetales bacterium]|nr:trypsin-like serine protease [Planctomycetales bacterium]
MIYRLANSRRNSNHRPFRVETLETKRCFSVSSLLETAETELAIVPSSEEYLQLAHSDDGHGGVVAIYENEFLSCTGSLLPTGRHILTAAHCVTYEGTATPFPESQYDTTVKFDLDGEFIVRDVVREEFHPNWDGTVAHGYDIAILELSEEAPAEADRYDIWRNIGSELGRSFTKVGYGLNGSGANGMDDDQLADSQNGLNVTARHLGENEYELGDSLLLAYDFDDGSSANALAALGYDSSTGLGPAREANLAKGDSGGPNFIDGLIAGVTSFGMTADEMPDVTPGVIDFSFGEIGVDTRVAAFADWVDSHLPPMQAAVDGTSNGTVITNDRTVRLTLEDSRWDATAIRVTANGTEIYSSNQVTDYLDIMLPSARAEYDVTVEVTYSDGSVKHDSMTVRYVRPDMQLNQGDTVTNTGRMSFDFANLASNAESFQVLVNGHTKIDWTSFQQSPFPDVQLNWKGTNYIQGRIRYADGRTYTIYRTIDYSSAQLEVNGGATVTNTGKWQPAINGIDSTAQRIRFKVNGYVVSDWQDVDGEYAVPRLNYRGTNYLQADIEYNGGITKSIYSRIDFVRPTILLNQGAASTDQRDIQVDLADVDPSAVSMKVAINRWDFSSVASQEVRSSFNVQLPAWHGRNYVNVQLTYEDGSTLWIYASIVLE